MKLRQSNQAYRNVLELSASHGNFELFSYLIHEVTIKDVK